MTRWAWTGSRVPKPAGRFPRHQELLVMLNVMETVVLPGDEVGTGGASGVDELVIQAALLLRVKMDIRIVVFPADGERTWDQTKADIHLIRLCDEVFWRQPGWKYLERDRALVDWADLVTAMPDTPFCWTVPGKKLAVVPHSGTSYTARYALEQNKLYAMLALNGNDHWHSGGRIVSETHTKLLRSMAIGPV